MSWFGKISDTLKGFTDHVQAGAKNVRENILGGFEDARDIGEKVLHDAAVLGNVASLGAVGQKLADSGKLDSIFEKASAESNGSKGGLHTGVMDVLSNVGNAVTLGQADAVANEVQAKGVAAGVAGATADLANAAANLADVNKAGRGYEAELQIQSDSAASEKEAGE